MVKKAILWAAMPFVVKNKINYDDRFVQSVIREGWSRCEMQGDFLLKHINTSFAKNIVCFSKKCDNLSLMVPTRNSLDPSGADNHCITISHVDVYCFDTGIGICTMQIPCDCDIEESVLVDTCSLLHCSVRHPDEKNGKPVFLNGTKTYLSCIAEQFLDNLLGKSYTLFGTFNDTSLQRVNMFSAVLCDKDQEGNSSESYNKWCYLLANAYDTRDTGLCVDDQHCYHQHAYIRWSFSKRGCAAVANLTDTALNDEFLNNRWFVSMGKNYFYPYLIVLHQKLASYYYLNKIAEDPSMNHLEINQKSLIEFNSKYIFSIISDEPFVQNVYLNLKKASNADEVYAELLEQLRRMFDYAQLKSNEADEVKNHKLNLISVIIAVVCSISIVFDSIELFKSYGCEFGFQSAWNIVFTIVVAIEVVIFLLFLFFTIFMNKRNK